MPRTRSTDDLLDGRGRGDTATFIERHLDGAARNMQREFEAALRLVEHRIESNQAASEARIDGLVKLSDERWAAFRAHSAERDSGIASIAERQLNELHANILLRIEAIQNARAATLADVTTRFAEVARELERLEEAQRSYVREAVYLTDMSRLYTERREQMSEAEASRRANLATMITSSIAVLGLLVTIALRFFPNH